MYPIHVGLSLVLDTIFEPSAVTQTEVTLEVCPSKICSQFPLDKSQIRTVLSSDPDTILEQSIVTQTEVTLELCPCSV